MLGATNFVEHYAVEFHATDAQKDFVKSAMRFGPEKGEKKNQKKKKNVVSKPGMVAPCLA